MRLDFRPYALVYTDNVNIADVHFIIIDEHDRTIECNDEYGMVIALIYYQDCEEVGYLKYNHFEELTGDSETIVKNGKLNLEVIKCM